jgi:UDP-glucuronate 4-epimerase
MKKVLITGVAGFIGSHTAEKLVARGDRVIGLDNFNTFYDPGIKRRNIAGLAASPLFRLYEGDICDPVCVRTVFEHEKPEVVVHLAARAGVRPSLQEPNLYNQVNVIGSQHILDACRDFGVSHLVFASSSSVYGINSRAPFKESDPVAHPVSPYAATKRMNELQAHVYSHVYGLHVTMLRFFTVYGPRQRPDMAIHRFARAVLREEPVPIYGDGSAQRDFTYIDDIVQGVVQCVDTPFRYEIFNLGGEHTVDVLTVVRLIERAAGKRAQLRFLPAQPGDVPLTSADVSHARALLGYNPTVPLEEGVTRFVSWLKETL